uniref:Uncharacterized protein n=1 Tax=Arion vulgaris TaxID=1028688 RepID=A0A0B7B582_9EUPU
MRSLGLLLELQSSGFVQHLVDGMSFLPIGTELYREIWLNQVNPSSLETRNTETSHGPS